MKLKVSQEFAVYQFSGEKNQIGLSPKMDSSQVKYTVKNVNINISETKWSILKIQKDIDSA